MSASAPLPQHPAIKLTVEKNIATITLSDPVKLNALDIPGYNALGVALRHVAELPEVSITILTGTGRFFSAGADVTGGFQDEVGEGLTERQFWFRRFASNNLDLTRAFYTHPKILVAALNGPAIGLSAALIAFSDFIYATPKTFVLTPFTSLGLVAEGGASYMFVKRMGIAKANEALMLSKRITCEELVQCGFVNKVFPEADFHKTVRAYVEDIMGPHLDHDSMMKVKRLIVEGWERELETVNFIEALGGVQRFVDGKPQAQFAAIASGQKKHKL